MLALSRFTWFALVCHHFGTSSETNVPHDSDLVADYKDLPVLVPDVSKIPSVNLSGVNADKFLSLWHSHALSDDVIVSDEPSTLIIPLNSAFPNDPTSIGELPLVLLNHAITGEVVNKFAAAKNGDSFYSAADSELFFTRKGANFYVNGIKLTGEELIFGNLMVYIVDQIIPFFAPDFYDYVDGLPEETTKSPNSSLTTTESTTTTRISQTITTSPPKNIKGASKSISRPTRFEKFRDDNVNKAVQDDKKIKEDETSSVSRASDSRTTSTSEDKVTPLSDNTSPKVTNEKEESTSLPKRISGLFETLFSEGNLSSDHKTEVENHEEFLEFGEELIPDSKSPDFFTSLMKELRSDKSRFAEFIYHFTNIHLEKYFDADKNYTAVIPTNVAFYSYYPIDWGFNPFLVDNFTKEVLLNHFMEGDIHLHMFNDSVEIQTIGGSTIRVTKDQEDVLLVNGNMIPREMEIELSHGRIYPIDELLFVDYDRVKDLRDEYPWLETAPLIGYPWPTSPFLSHLLQRLQEIKDAKIFYQLLRKSRIAHLMLSSDDDLNRLTYSAFVPTDEALKGFIGTETLELLDPETVDNFLREHMVSGYLFEKDLADGYNLMTVANTAMPIKLMNGSIYIGASKIVKPQEYIYNLGSLFFIDSPFGKYHFNISKDSSLHQKASEIRMLPLSSTFNNPKSSLGVNRDEVEETTPEPEFQYEVRTEVSFSRQINGGIMEPITREVMEIARLLHNRRPL